MEVRKTCKTCKIHLINNQRTFCSKECRNKHYNQKYKESRNTWVRVRNSKYEEGKIQCIICGGWYKQVCSHVIQRHGMTNREYKKLLGKDVKKGILSSELYKTRKTRNLETKEIAWANFEKGIKFRFKKGDSSVGKYERSEQSLERLREHGKKILQAAHNKRKFKNNLTI